LQKFVQKFFIFAKFFVFIKSFALSLFLKEQKSDRSFHCSFWESKRAIALFVALLKRAKKERILIRSFAKSNKMSNRSIALLKGAEMRHERMSDCPTLQPGLAISPFAHFENEGSLFFWAKIWKSEWGIALFIALFKIAKERSLFWKEQLLICSFAKSDKKSNRSFTLFKRANEQAITQLLFWKERWANEQLPNPDIIQYASAVPLTIQNKTVHTMLLIFLGRGHLTELVLCEPHIYLKNKTYLINSQK